MLSVLLTECVNDTVVMDGRVSHDVSLDVLLDVSPIIN